MNLTIGARVMRSDRTDETATLTAEGWTVSWLPDRFFDRNGAITALSLAEIYADNPPPDQWGIWALARDWEDELGIDRRQRP